MDIIWQEWHKSHRSLRLRLLREGRGDAGGQGGGRGGGAGGVNLVLGGVRNEVLVKLVLGKMDLGKMGLSTCGADGGEGEIFLPAENPVVGAVHVARTASQHSWQLRDDFSLYLVSTLLWVAPKSFPM